MRRIRLKRKRKIPVLTNISILLLLLTVSTIIAFRYIGKNITYKIQEYAEVQAKKLVSLVVSESVDDDIINSLDNKSLFITSEDTVDFDSATINEILIKVNKNVKSNLYKLEKGQVDTMKIDSDILPNSKKLKKGIIYEVPTGIIFDNALLANIGPKIPVKLDMVGDIKADVKTDVKDYGINNAVIKISIEVEVNEKVVLPYDTSQISIVEEIPLTIKMIEGEIPDYYASGNSTPYVVENQKE